MPRNIVDIFFYNNSPDNVNAYVPAYSIDSDTRKITYVLHENFDCPVMTAEGALPSVIEANPVSYTQIRYFCTSSPNKYTTYLSKSP